MRRIYIIGVLVSLFYFHEVVFGFTVVLKTGKRIEGTWIGEDQNTITLRDRDGVLLSVRKSTVDFDAMSSSRLSASNGSEPTAVQEKDRGISAPDIKPTPTQQKNKQSYRQELWHVDTTIASAYDSNIDHDPDATESYGLVYGAEVQVQNRQDHPSLELSYGIAKHSYSNTDKWDRISHDFLAVYSRKLSHHFRFETEGEISLKGSSEDREISNQYIVEPHFKYKINGFNDFDFYCAYRLKRYDVEDRNSVNRYAGVQYERAFGKHQLEISYRYETNDALDPENSFHRSTYGIQYLIPFGSQNKFSIELKYRPQKYEARYVEVPGPDVLRLDKRWIFTTFFVIGLWDDLDLIPSYKFETRNSNDLDKDFSAHLPEVLLRYRW